MYDSQTLREAFERYMYDDFAVEIAAGLRRKIQSEYQNTKGTIRYTFSFFFANYKLYISKGYISCSKNDQISAILMAMSYVNSDPVLTNFGTRMFFVKSIILLSEPCYYTITVESMALESNSISKKDESIHKIELALCRLISTSLGRLSDNSGKKNIKIFFPNAYTYHDGHRFITTTLTTIMKKKILDTAIDIYNANLLHIGYRRVLKVNAFFQSNSRVSPDLYSISLEWNTFRFPSVAKSRKVIEEDINYLLLFSAMLCMNSEEYKKGIDISYLISSEEEKMYIESAIKEFCNSSNGIPSSIKIYICNYENVLPDRFSNNSFIRANLHLEVLNTSTSKLN